MKLPHTEVLPLYGRLSAAEQHRVFGRHTGRRIVLATNVAETSLTVPGHPLRRRRRHRAHLPLQPAHQGAAAADRADLARPAPTSGPGRCGRVADGICIRLYSEEDYESRPEFTDPEILRTNLASVILQMTVARARRHRPLPVRRRRRTPARSPTASGCSRSCRPSTPRTAQPTRAARRGSRPHGRTIARAAGRPAARRGWSSRPDQAGRAARGARHRAGPVHPGPARAAAGEAGSRPTQRTRGSPTSTRDFVALLNLWALPQGAAEGAVRQRFPPDVQARSTCTTCGSASGRTCTASSKAASARRPRHLAADHSGRGRRRPRSTSRCSPGCSRTSGSATSEKREYLGARGARFGISPGSALFRKQPQWVMSAELVETTRLWARVNARIDPVWAERLAGHLVKRTYSRAALVAQARAPRWRPSGSRSTACRWSSARTVSYARVNPEESRDLFIRHALVEGDWDTHHGSSTTTAPCVAAADRARAPGAAARHRRRRRDAGGVLRRADARRGRVACATSTRWWKNGRAARRPTC